MNREDLNMAIDKATKVFKTIMSNYPGLKGYLVFSSPRGQCELTDDPEQILKEFPAMICESESKDIGNVLLEAIQGLRAELKSAYWADMQAKIQKKIDKESILLAATLEKVTFKEETFIEIRFSRPILDLIFEMQKDPLVSQEHTPQTQASIRIVLGMLSELAQQQRDI
jgi:hypothetical protein